VVGVAGVRVGVEEEEVVVVVVEDEEEEEEGEGEWKEEAVVVVEGEGGLLLARSVRGGWLLGAAAPHTASIFS